MGPFLGVPVIYASEPIGAFYVARPPGRELFSQQEQERLEELAPYAAIAMANARMLEGEHRRVAIAEALAAAARSLQRGTDERQIGEVLADALEAIFADAAELAACWSTADAEHQHPPRWDGTTLCQALDRFVDARSEPGQVDDAELGAELVPGRHCTVHVTRLDDGGRLALAVAHPVPVTISDEGRVALSTLAEIGAIALAAARRREAEAALERYAVRDEIARDLHDDLIQSIYAIGLSLRATATAEAGVLESALSKARDDLNVVIRDLRSYIAHLSERPQELTRGAILAARIDSMVRDPGMRVPWTVVLELGDPSLGRRLERQLYLIVREAVSNVERHANANAASLRLQRRGNVLHLEISDDGWGFDRSAVPDGSVGLRSIEQRVAELGGSVVIASAPGEGTSLIATLPTEEPEEREDG